MKKLFFKSLPYIASILAGIGFYLLATIPNNSFYDLLINISAAFFAIPLLYLFYELANNFSHRRLNKEIFDYAKVQVDTEVLSIINQLQKIVYSLDKKDFSTNAIGKFLSITKDEIGSLIAKNKYLGFQIVKSWEVNENNLHNILKNPFVLEKIDDEQIISIINLIKSIRQLESIQKIQNLYFDTGEKTSEHIMTSGKDIHPDNTKFPDRYLLLKKLDGDKFLVDDFGDIPQYSLEKCLNVFRIREEYKKNYCEVIFDLIEEINNWLSLTGKEFIVDTKTFRMVHPKTGRGKVDGSEGKKLEA